jgi:hypothetical protein
MNINTPCDSRDGCISMVKEFVPILDEFAATYLLNYNTEAFLQIIFTPNNF